VKNDAAIARERGALGAAIVDGSGRQLAIMLALLRPEHFLSPFHRHIYRALGRLYQRYQANGPTPVDYVTLAAELMDMEVFQQYANAYASVTELGDGIVLRISMRARCEDIKTAYRQRCQVKEHEGAHTAAG
jgi:replicative DNA helicase